MSNINFDIPWHKYGTVSYLAKKLPDKSPQFGKTILQKIVYILQEIYKVPCGYNYSLYTYGPYCGELSNDLDYVSFLNGVNVDWEPFPGGYEISAGEKCDHIIEKAGEFIKSYNDEIDMAIQKFGKSSAKDLELISTIIYVERYAKRTGESISIDEIINEVEEIKPKFDRSEIKKKVEILSKERTIL